MGGTYVTSRLLYSFLLIVYDRGDAGRERSLQVDKLFDFEYICNNLLRYRC